MTGNLSSPPATGSRTRWWIVGIVVAVVACLIGTGIFAFDAGRSTNGSVPTFQREDWQPPPQVVLASTMRERPMPGWRATGTDLGLPDTTIFAESDRNPGSTTPFVGSVNNNAYFLASSPGSPDRQQWLVGLDVDTGERLFHPVKIDAGQNFLKCFLNGPETVLCLADDVQDGNAEGMAWVVDAKSGDIMFNGPSQLHATPVSNIAVQQVGIYAVAEVRDKGVYGVGPHAETTWFVPGATKVKPAKWPADFVPPALAVAQNSAMSSNRVVIFSLIDGKVITPHISGEGNPLTAVVYPGGLAVEAATDTNSSIPDTVVFLDDAGNYISETNSSGDLTLLSMTLPMLKSSPSYTIFGGNGADLLELPGAGLGPDSVLIGHRVYVPESNWEGPVKVRRWRQFDLTTGGEGNTCRSNMSHYVANDGHVGVFETGRNDAVGATSFAMDLATCEKLWTIPVNPDSFHRLWHISGDLVELSDDGTELHSLVASE
ncbi:hypothetical protein [Mycolicibacterium fortuitum]|nr:hypothetical protein [Mycolicibacterium fortuitum]AIY47814.2 hypothetical protein G155_22155 [Mycobacterium sp. VKM Ac-1817D]